MDDAIKDLERLKNKPRGLTEKELHIKQVPFRLHENDYRALKKLLRDDNWRFQHLMAACVDAYINRNPLLIKLLADWKEDNVIPKKMRDRYSLSNREKKNLLDELEEMAEKEDE